MRIDLDNLPADTSLLHHLVRDMEAVVESRDGEIERLQLIIKKLQRAQFGRRSERLDPDQLALALEELDGDIARIRESCPAVETTTPEIPSRRRSLPDHLPRENVLLDVEDQNCACCGGALHSTGESVSEMLDWVPAHLRVLRIARPKYACRACGTIAQAPAPERLIAGGLATPALLSQALIAKYCDHTPLYRQSQIFARHGVDLSRSTLADWVGGACWWLEALHDWLCKNVFASTHLFADDTPIPVLDPGRGRTKTGRLWVYAREQRPWSGPEPRRRSICTRRTEGLNSGVASRALQGCAARRRLCRLRAIGRQGRCRARRLLGSHEAQVLRSRRSHRLARGGRNAAPDRRTLRRRSVRVGTLVRSSPRGAAILLQANCRGSACLAGSSACPARWAIVCTLVETAKLNGVEPYAYCADVLQRMVDGHPVNRLGELLPWAWKAGNSVNT